MRFAFSEDALLLQSTVRDFLRKEAPPEVVRALWDAETGHDPALWQKLAGLGVVGALVPDAHGGMGLDECDLVLLMEELGRVALPVPLVPTAAVAAPLLRDAGDAALAAAWLPRLAAGEVVVAVGHPANPFVADAGVASLLLLADGDALHAVEPAAVTLERQPANDPGRRLFRVGWRPAPATRLAEGAAARALLGAALDRGAIACAAQAIGVADQILQLAVDYALERQQFGRAIGSFQALQHQLASVKVRVEYARPVVYKAAFQVARTASSASAAARAARAADVSHAKLAATEAAAAAARVALQVHGAIGYTWEQDLQLWMRRAWSLERDFGDAPFHTERVAAFVLADGAPIGPGRTFQPHHQENRDG